MLPVVKIILIDVQFRQEFYYICILANYRLAQILLWTYLCRWKIWIKNPYAIKCEAAANKMQTLNFLRAEIQFSRSPNCRTCSAWCAEIYFNFTLRRSGTCVSFSSAPHSSSFFSISFSTCDAISHSAAINLFP